MYISESQQLNQIVLFATWAFVNYLRAVLQLICFRELEGRDVLYPSFQILLIPGPVMDNREIEVSIE